MATPFIDLNEAAAILGLTPEQVIEMRSSGALRGFRDGSSWKFKPEDVEQAKAELADGPADSGPLAFDGGLGESEPGEEDEDAPSVLVNDAGTGPKAEGSASKIIGKSGDTPDAESDLKLSGDSSMALGSDSSYAIEDEGSEISLDAGSSKRGGSAMDSDVSLVPGVGTDSDVTLVPDTGSDRSLKAPPGLNADVLGDSDLRMKTGSSGGTGALTGGGSSKALGSGLGSEDLDIALDSELALSEDDEMVLGGSGVGSDLTLNPAADSGINLSSPSDSGLSLEADSGISLQSPTDSGLSLEEEPVDMGGSSISALELPEDEAVDLEAEPAQNLKKDEEFLLSPSDEMFTDESDSGSQVIALEDSAAFDQEGGLIADDGLLTESSDMDQQLDALGGAATPMVGPSRVGAGGPPEAPYSVWNIVGLVTIIMLLTVTGVLMSDIMRNMWAWEDGLDMSTSISVGISKAFGLD